MLSSMDEERVDQEIDDEKIIHISRKKRKKKNSVNQCNVDTESISDNETNTILRENKKLKEAHASAVHEIEQLKKINCTLYNDGRYNDLLKIINDQNKIIDSLRKELTSLTTTNSSVDKALVDESPVEMEEEADEFPPLPAVAQAITNKQYPSGEIQQKQQSSVPLSELSTPAVQKGIDVKSASTNAALKKPRTM